MPALKKYAEQKHYANLKFIDIDVEEGLDAAGLAPLDFAANRYNYIIISLGDAEYNWLAASELITQIGAARSEKQSDPFGVLVNVFNEFSDNIGSDEQAMLAEHGEENGIEVHFFGNESVTGTELDRIARNINFSYGMKYDQRINKKKPMSSLKRAVWRSLWNRRWIMRSEMLMWRRTLSGRNMRQIPRLHP